MSADRWLDLEHAGRGGGSAAGVKERARTRSFIARSYAGMIFDGLWMQSSNISGSKSRTLSSLTVSRCFPCSMSSCSSFHSSFSFSCAGRRAAGRRALFSNESWRRKGGAAVASGGGGPRRTSRSMKRVKLSWWRCPSCRPSSIRPAAASAKSTMAPRPLRATASVRC